MGHGLNNRPGSSGRVTALEHARADKHSIAAQLHHQGGIRRRRHPTGGELDHRQPPQLLGLHHQIARRGDLLRKGEHLIIVHVPQNPDLTHHAPHVTYGLDDVSRPSLTLGSNHGGAFSDAAERLPQIAAATNKGDLEVMLVDVVVLVGGGQNLGFVDIVDSNGFQDLGLNEMPNSGLRHDRDCDGALYVLNELRV
uniref:Uncharacterized protein n=1 Tax=Opuntia streptacantha TaxID=393608 RepID=A0A7C9DZC8_OPUST